MSLRIYKDAVCIVTGGASGIGRALVSDLSRRGAYVVIADRQIALAEEIAAELNEELAEGQTARITAVELDVTEGAAFRALTDAVFEEHGRLDFLFNNAGIVNVGPFRRFSLDDHLRQVDVNLKGVLCGVHAVYARMCEQGFGHIVNTASISGLVVAPWFTTYGATKHAVVGLSKNLRLEAKYDKTGVRVSAICPGFIRTAMLTGGVYGSAHVAMANEKKATATFIEPDQLARRALNQVARNKGIIIVPGYWRLVWSLLHWFPSLESVAASQMMGGRHVQETQDT